MMNANRQTNPNPNPNPNSASPAQAAPARTQAAGNKPAHTVRIGAIRAAVWENHSGENIWYSVSLSRLYKDGDQWKNSESFNRDDLLAVAKVADQAHTWICEQQAGG
jgi:hypothetical protein